LDTNGFIIPQEKYKNVLQKNVNRIKNRTFDFAKTHTEVRFPLLFYQTRTILDAKRCKHICVVKHNMQNICSDIAKWVQDFGTEDNHFSVLHHGI